MKGKYTKFRMMAAFNVLLEKYEYDDITVSMIADYCGVSRQAFYKNFESKQDLCAQMIITVFRDCLKECKYFTWNTLIEAYISQTETFMDFFHTLSTPEYYQMAQNAIFSHLCSICDAMIEYRTGAKPGEDMHSVICCYCTGVTFVFMDIVRKGINPDINLVCRRLFMAMPQMLRSMLPGISYPVSVQQKTFPGKDENGLNILSDLVKEFEDCAPCTKN